MFAEQQQGWEELGLVGDSSPSRKDRGLRMYACLLLLVAVGGSTARQVGGLMGLASVCQCQGILTRLQTHLKLEKVFHHLIESMYCLLHLGLWGKKPWVSCQGENI